MKALRTAAIVVGAAAVIVASAGALAPIATTAALASIGITASATAIATGLALGAAVLSTVAGPAKPKGTVGGNPTKFTINKESGYPYAIGRTYSGGRVVHRQYYGPKNAHESWVTVHSIGPVKSLGALEIDKQAEPFSGGAAVGAYAGYMWLDEQLGACPETNAMTGPLGDFPGWGASSKLSGLAADLWTLKFDDKGKKYPTGVPQRGRIIEGVYVYDPRFDSTYPGGMGDCRLGDEATYVWSENPALHALTWAFGRIQNGILIAGGGLPVTGIDLAPFVEWANVCEVNNWKVGGIVYTADDDSWDVLKMIAQAGGGEVMPVGALLSCTFSAPRVSIGLITSNDIIGDVDVPCSASRRTRRNTVIPRVRLESHGWEMIPLEATEIPAYVAIDGGRRPKEVVLPLVQDADQGTQLGLYDLLNARELNPIVLPCKITALGYRPGDCLTVDIPEASLSNREVVVREREIDGGNFGVTLTCRTEDPAKHPFALGKAGTPPPTPDLSVPPYNPPLPAPRTVYTITVFEGANFPIASASANSITTNAITATIDDTRVFEMPAVTISGLAAGTYHGVFYEIATGAMLALPQPATAQMASDAYVFVTWQATQNTGDGTYPVSPTPPGGYVGGGRNPYEQDK